MPAIGTAIGLPFARSGGFVGALDAYTAGLSGAWGISRRLLARHSSSLLRVRRSTDSTESDIGVTATGDLDTTALLAFCGAGNGFITKVYDQSGNGNDLTQTSASAQPRIVSAGVVDTVGGVIAARFFNSSTTSLTVNSLAASRPWTLFQVDQATSSGRFLSGKGNNFLLSSWNGFFERMFAGTWVYEGTSTTQANRVHAGVGYSNNTCDYFLNGTRLATAVAATNNPNGLSIGGGGAGTVGGEYINGFWFGGLCYTSSLSASNVQAISTILTSELI